MVKSPPWIIKLGIILWKVDDLYDSCFPLTWLWPFSPVHRARKFSTVFGTSSPKSPITMRPEGSPPISISKKTLFVTLATSLRTGCGHWREKRNENWAVVLRTEKHDGLALRSYGPRQVYETQYQTQTHPVADPIRGDKKQRAAIIFIIFV